MAVRRNDDGQIWPVRISTIRIGYDAQCNDSMELAWISWRKFILILRSQVKATPHQHYDIHLCDWRRTITAIFLLVAESDGFGRFSSAPFRVRVIVSGVLSKWHSRANRPLRARTSIHQPALSSIALSVG